MPRVTRVKSAKKHGSAVQLPSQRGFAVPDSKVADTIIPGQQEEQVTKAVEIGPSDVSFTKLKKGKQPQSALVPDHLLHPYSRSHNRREKRKAKNQLAGGELNAIATALSEAIGEEPPTIHVDKRGREIKKDEAELREERRKREAEKGKIGEGKGRTMNETKRRKQIALESKRIPAVMAHPAYKESPWSTIRLHASNSLAAKDVPSSAQGGPKAKKVKSDRMEVEH